MTTVPLKRVAWIRYGLGQPPKLSDNGVPILRATNVSKGRITEANMLRATVADLPLDRAPLLAEGEILVVRSGAYTGDSARITDEWAGSAPGYDLRVTPQSVDSRYLAYALLGSAALDQMVLASTRAAQPHLNAEELGEVEVWVPSLEQQRRIADFLDAETAQIDQLQRLRTRHRLLLAERTRQHIQELALGYGLPASRSGNPWIRMIPNGWTVLPLKRRWRIVDCKHRTPEYADEGYPVVSPGDISPGRLDLAVAHRFVGQQDFEDLADDTRRPRRGDIVYSRNASVGIAAYVDTDAPFTMGQDVCRITSPDQDQLFLTYVLNSVALAELESLQVGSTFTRVNIGTLLELSVPCPPPEQQRDIARRMDEVSAMGSALDQKIEQQLALLGERRQALITAAVTGQFDVSTASGRNVTDGVSA